jgi:protein TonB
MLDNQLHAPTKIPKKIEQIKEESAPPQVAGVAGGIGTGGAAGGVLGGIIGGLGAGTAPVVKAAAPTKKTVSSGVIAGLIISKVQPVYPPIARAAHVSGTVVLHITISKTGAVENVQVVSGPAMLQNSAVDAIRQYRYKPFLLNGEPTEVDGTITVNYVAQ